MNNDFKMNNNFKRLKRFWFATSWLQVEGNGEKQESEQELTVRC